MGGRWGVGLVVLVALAGCQRVSVESAGRPCDGAGNCAEGWVCHPEIRLCVLEVAHDCASPRGACPGRTLTGDACQVVGAFLPCATGVDDCRAGCRTCLSDGLWSGCTATTCELGRVWSCADCDNDCRIGVLNATAACGAGVCNYSGDCDGGYADRDGDRRNGCECVVVGDGTEHCDGLDNDCNGVVDDGFGLGASCGVGECAGGAQECAGGSATVCDRMPGGSKDVSSAEVCDGLDNDCDGRIDEAFGCELGANFACDFLGIPGAGEQRCNPTCQWDPCRQVWADAGAAHRLRIDIDGTGLSAPLTDVPVLVELTPMWVNYADLAGDGSDLRFYAADAVTVLDHQIDTWVNGGASSIWVRLPSLAVGMNTIFAYYDRQLALTAPDPALAWDGGFAGVWHLSEPAPGRGVADAFADATGGSAGDDFVSAAGKGGVIGPGQSFGIGDHIRVDGGPFGEGTGFTLEGWFDTTGPGWSYTRLVTLTPAVTRAGYQTLVRLDPSNYDYSLGHPAGADLRLFTLDGDPLPHQRASWDTMGNSNLWVRLPAAGIDRVYLHHGNPEAASAEDPQSVFDFYDDFLGTAVDLGRWSITPGSAHSVAASILTLQTGAIGVSAPLGFNLTDSYRIETSVRFDELGTGYSGVGAEVSSSPFTASGNGNDDATVFVMRTTDDREVTVWAGSGATTSYDIDNDTRLYDSTEGNFNWHDIILEPDRIQVFAAGAQVLDRTGITWTKPINYLSLGTFNGSTMLPMQQTSYSLVRVRKHGPQPTTSTLEATASAVGRPGRFGIAVDDAAATATLGGTQLVTSLTPGWHHVALVYEPPMIAIYVDGAFASGTLAPPAGLLPASDFIIGDRTGQPARVDEVRFSTVARSADWLRFSYDVMTGSRVSYGGVEVP